MTELFPLLILVPIILLAGLLVGSIGIGGVVLVPALSYLAGIEIHIAIAACMLSYVFSGFVGAVIYARRGTIRWVTALWLCFGAMPGAYLGALTVAYLPQRTITFVVGIFIVFASVNALRESKDISQNKQKISKVILTLIGFLVGLGSAISGTGGPLLLVPMLIWLKWPVLTAVGLSQIIQLPIAVLATLGNYLHGEINVQLGLSIALVMMIGVAIGARVAHRLPALLLRRIVAFVLSVVGISMLWQVFS